MAITLAQAAREDLALADAEERDRIEHLARGFTSIDIRPRLDGGEQTGWEVTFNGELVIGAATILDALEQANMLGEREPEGCVGGLCSLAGRHG